MSVDTDAEYVRLVAWLDTHGYLATDAAVFAREDSPTLRIAKVFHASADWTPLPDDW